MRFSNKKGVNISIETLVKLILLTAFLIVVVSLAIGLSGSFSNQGAKKYGCWFSSSARSSTSLAGVIPDTCSTRVIEDALDMRGVALLLRDTWWMYGRGEADFSLTDVKVGDVYEAARFKVLSDTKVEDLLQYLLTTRKGRAVPMEKSDYNYLQEGAIGSTVCFDSNFKEDDFNLKPGIEYKLYFADSTTSILPDVLGGYMSDKLIVMKELKPRSFWFSENKFFCLSPLTKVRSEGTILQEASWLLGGGWFE